MQLDALIGRIVLGIKGISYLPAEEEGSELSLEGLEFILENSESLSFTAGTNWALRVEKGEWPGLPRWCYPSGSWQYSDVHPLAVELSSRVCNVEKHINALAELTGVDVQFENGSRVSVTSGRVFTVMFIPASVS
ncbi:hypothetical protein ACH4TQ_30360 [Streptomyces sp. NPDC021218]|uniref:hypothetical protein n=1 Tax=Streptomyces sp. NPDC021218 TaxID=3365119 RepID=UPI0037B92C6A